MKQDRTVYRVVSGKGRMLMAFSCDSVCEFLQQTCESATLPVGHNNALVNCCRNKCINIKRNTG